MSPASLNTFLAIALVACAAATPTASAQLLNGGDGGGPSLESMFGGQADTPDIGDNSPALPRPQGPLPTFDDSDGSSDDDSSEQIDTPSASEDARRVTVGQPIASFDTRTGTWLPDGSNQEQGWMPEIEVPEGLIDCTSGGQIPGPRCRVWRSLVKPTDPSLNPRCVVCVKEPYLDYETVQEELRVVIQRCFETSEPFKHKGCEGGHWYEASGTTKLRKLHSCEARAPVKYLKPVVRYRDVYYYIHCGNEQQHQQASY